MDCCKVSIIMGVYNIPNREVFDLAMNSILEQTFQEFEFVICDDGSTDNTYQILNEYADKDRRIVLIKNEKNMGLAATLNRCIEKAKGNYIARMDADDISYRNRIEEQYRFLEINKEYSIVGCNADLIDKGKIWGKRNMPERPEKEAFLWGSPFIHPSIMVRREAYEINGGYRCTKSTRRMEDYDLFMRFYASGHKGYNLQKTYFVYREDHENLKRRKYRYRIDEFKIRINGFRMLGLYPRGLMYAIKPLIVGLIPHRIIRKIRGEEIIER